MYESHLSRHARDRYGLESLTFQSLQQTRGIAAQMKVSAADLYALGLIDEVLRLLLRQYEMQHPGLMGRALDLLDKGLDPQSVRKTQVRFIDDFPPALVYRAEMTSDEYLASESGGIPRRQTSLEELLLLHLHNANAAAMSLSELFDDASLQEMTVYPAIIEKLHTFFSHQPSAGAGGENLIQLLRAPALASPHSLSGQLEYILNRWGALLGEGFVSRLLRGLDFVKEEIRRSGTGGFAGDAPLLSFGHGEHEYERFSPDKDWMPRLVLIAKNSCVWLDQLSKKYQRWIKTLDQIPDEELDTLRQRGITGLWLIGLWERSRASQRIKQMMGNADAVASAYSLMDYQIAADLGGWEALGNLRWRAWQRGIRLSADMVPNHMGIDSGWVVEHPDWFLSLPYPPYPNYSFNGPDLFSVPRAGIFLEDHYYDKTDAAVVFRLSDYQTHQTRYIYHGNDGTSMPWNDTAQLDYSKAEVREAVIQAILQVARNFPIIRFDAAMTLARKHIQRLWFPEPGAGGAIPSRAEHGMTRSEFEAAIPNEFWREVVDRVAAEVPDTLLLAEAFWMMEGYFVRTLGMHRVYNSAFMHMLRDEDNAKYRQVMKNTLEFDPQVLKRYVNFMNNPDEKTASEQFGTTDKYFGVCTLLVTLPGLPMFGHGQIEGFREKYGMEYRRAYWDESVDEGLVRGHEGRIFPLTHRRHIFAEVEKFLLYDFFTPDGNVNEDVFAYSNGFVSGYEADKPPDYGGKRIERGLVIYHNKYAHTSGWVKTSAAFMDKNSGKLIQKTLGEGLGLPAGLSDYVTFRDYGTNLEYIRSCNELVEKGLYVELGGYQCHVFMDWRFVSGDQWAQVCTVLSGAGAPSLQAKFDELFAPRVEVKEVAGKQVKRKRVKSKQVSKETSKKVISGKKKNRR
ncbi:MAG: alpha-amylase family glycosyl hydrolase [Anaerolineales bacterium]|nr:alpha-amylase family glycosyl hydrolase [Anaerolineales bacterium]